MLIVMESIIFHNDISKIIKDFDCDTATELFTKYSELDPEIFDDNYTFHIIATEPNNLRLLLEFFKKFKLVKNQRIILKNIDVNTKELDIILDEFKDCDFMNRLFLDVSYDNSRDFVCKKEFDQMQNILSEIKEIIPKDASNLEIITYVYNWLKKREYKHDEENPTYSKLYSTALITEYIVCVGFSKVFNNILSEYGICASEYEYFFLNNNEKEGHDISIVNIKDEKYGINGLYFFDLTRDCYNKNNDKEHRYNGFMMTYEEVAKDTIVEDMFNKMLLWDSNDLQDTIDYLKVEIDKLNPQDEEDEFEEESVNKEIIALINNLIRTDSELFKKTKTIDMIYMNNHYGMIYFINRYILFLKQSLGTKVDHNIITDLLINTTKQKDYSYYIGAINTYLSHSTTNDYNLTNHFQYVKKSLDSNK